MIYVLDYEICAIVLLLIIGIHFFNNKRFPSLQNRFFSAFFFVAMLDFILDIITAFTISYSHFVAPWLIHILNTAFYAVRLILPPMLFLYVLCLMGAFLERNKKLIILALLPAGIQIVCVLLNFVTKWYFYINENGAFVHGKYIVTMYLIALFYISLSIVFLLKYKNRIRNDQLIAVFVCLTLIAFAVFIQQFFPTVLIIGFASALAMMLMYLTLQCPNEALDTLTGFFNRESFLTAIDMLNDGHKDYQLIVVDIDEMHPINNIFGIKVGDRIICELAKIIQNSTNSYRIFRIMGDEFAVITEDEVECMSTIYKIKERLLSPIVVGNISVDLSVCICYSTNSENCSSSDSVLPLIERSLYKAKKCGKNTLLCVDDKVIDMLERENVIEQIVRRAAAHKKFEVYFQPIYDVKKAKFTKMEALARLYSEELGWISPQEFIPIAERTGLILKLGEQIFDAVCKFIMKNKLSEHKYIDGISINLSVVECLDPKIFARIKSSIQKHNVDPNLIILEITETTASLSDKLPLFMKKINDFGINFALDDFGMGYANIDSVLRLPFSEIKLDRSILVESNTNEKSLIVLKQMLNLSRELGLMTLVEGVETPEQVELLNSLSADFIQGYYYSYPMHSEAVLEFIDSKNN